MAVEITHSRLGSLDVFRGITMFLLIAEGAGVWNAISQTELNESLLGPLTIQFHHHPWNGLRFWDLVQPFFMFIVGVAMPFSFAKRWARGDSYRSTLIHAAKRSLILLALGIGVYIVSAGKLTLELWNVLAQLSVTYFISFLVLRKSLPTQFILSCAILLLSESLYRFWSVVGFNQAFVPDQNFGAWVDLLLMGKLSGGHWVAFNAIPTTAHTLWGVMAGKILMDPESRGQALKYFSIVGILALVVGYGLDPFTPIIKRICTSSFVIVSGGWCLLALALCHYFVDLKSWKRGLGFAIAFGMNPIAVYLFTEIGGNGWLRNVVKPFSAGMFGWAGEGLSVLLTALFVLWINYRFVKWLQDRNIYFRI